MSCCSRKSPGLIIKLLYLTLTFIFHFAIFCVALLGLANFWLPFVDDYKEVIEKEVSDFLGNKVTIGKISVDRNSESPRWLIHDLQLTDKSGDIPIHIRQLALTVDWEESLRTLRLQPADIDLRGVEFILRQEKDALPKVQGLTFPLPGLKNTALDVERHSPIRVTLKDGYVHWMDVPNRRTLTLHNLSFMGEFLPDEITLQADASFPPQIGKTLAVDAVLKRVTLADGKHDWNGDLATRTRIFNLAALPSPLLNMAGVDKGSLWLDAHIKAEVGKPLHIQGEGEIKDLRLKGTDKVPALAGINATFKADNAGGQVQMHVQDSQFNYPQWFEAPMPIDQLDAKLSWQVLATGWDWQISDLAMRNRDLQVQGGGKLAMPLAKPLALDLKMTFSTQRVLDNVRQYIPSIVIDGTEKWLKTAIVAGYVPKGEFVLQGNPSDFPFKNKPGVFDIRFDIEKGILAYLPEWPEARDVKGELRFHNQGMSGKVKSARIMQLDVTGGEVDIPDMLGETHLLLDLRTKGDLQGHMDYLQTAPIGRKLRDFMQVAKFSGDSDLRLKLDVPLDAPVFEKKGVSVDGLVNLHQNTFAIPDYDQTFTRLQGQVYFDEVGVQTDKATADYRGEPITIKAVTDRRAPLIRLSLQQTNSPQAFLPQALQGLGAYMSGKTPITTQLELPAFTFGNGKGQCKASLQLQASSQLQGIDIRLPAPFGKTAQTALPLTVKLNIPFEGATYWDATINIPSLLNVRARLPHNSPLKTAIGVAMGEQAKVDLPTEGVAIKGQLPTVDILQWRELAAGGTASDEYGKKDKSSVVPLQLDLGVGDLRLGQQSFGAAQINARSSDILQANLRTTYLNADAHLPLANLASGRVNIAAHSLDLEQLSKQLPQAPKGKAQTDLSPVSIPSMRITCQQCRKGDMPLDSLTLDMNKVHNDLYIRALEIRQPFLTVLANQGRWYQGADGHSYTELALTAHSATPGYLWADKGSEPALRGGALTANARLLWAGAPFAFALENIKGEGHVSLGKGSLTAVEPGIGRLLGLLDVSRLSSRLAMDFHDMTDKGVSFDTISGHFQLDQGVLSTQDTLIKAPILVAGIHGSADLKQKTLDQTLTLIPNLRSTLPVIGTALAGLGGGLAAVLFNAATESAPEEAVKSWGALRYRITGPWDDPLINGSSSYSTPAPANSPKSNLAPVKPLDIPPG